MRITALSVVTCRVVLSEVLELARGTRTARGVLTLKPFLAWASDPKLEERKRMGKLVLLYMLITAVLLGLAKRRLWATVPH